MVGGENGELHLFSAHNVWIFRFSWPLATRLPTSVFGLRFSYYVTELCMHVCLCVCASALVLVAI